MRQLYRCVKWFFWQVISGTIFLFFLGVSFCVTRNSLDFSFKKKNARAQFMNYYTPINITLFKLKELFPPFNFHKIVTHCNDFHCSLNFIDHIFLNLARALRSFIWKKNWCAQFSSIILYSWLDIIMNLQYFEEIYFVNYILKPNDSINFISCYGFMPMSFHAISLFKYIFINYNNWS